MSTSVYDLSSGRVVPAWVRGKRRRELTKALASQIGGGRSVDEIQLVQDFGFPSAAQTICCSADGRYIVACGSYAPRVRVFDVSELSLKCERFMDGTAVSTLLLSEDYSKLAILQDNRCIELHAAYGKHHIVRMPHFGRCMAYHAPTCDAVIACSSSVIHRLNLEEGRFMSPLDAGDALAVNVVATSRVTALIGAGCSGASASVILYDPRSHARVADLKVAAGGVPIADVTALDFKESSLTLGVGTATGDVLLYDLRSSVPVRVKSHPYGEPITKVKFHRGRGSVSTLLSADERMIRLWREEDGAAVATLEPSYRVNDVAIVSDASEVGGIDSGLILVAGESERIGTYYLPALGVAPRWASHLDALTEELDASTTGAGGATGTGVGDVYDDYKFITREELDSLKLTHLIGTPLLRAYMHGFFMDSKLYTRARGMSDPFAFEAWKKGKVRDAIDATRGSRIVMSDVEGTHAVNADLAKRLDKKAKKKQITTTAAGETVGGSTSLARDPRFAKLFSDKDFEVDPEEEANFTQHPPRKVARMAAVDDDEEEEEGDAGDSSGTEDSDARAPARARPGATATATSVVSAVQPARRNSAAAGGRGRGRGGSKGRGAPAGRSRGRGGRRGSAR